MPEFHPLVTFAPALAPALPALEAWRRELHVRNADEAPTELLFTTLTLRVPAAPRA